MRKAIYLYFLFISLTSIGQNFVINEDFNSGIPTDWQLIINDTNTLHNSVAELTEAWNIIENPDSTGDSVLVSTSYFQEPGTASRWLISPQVQLGTFGNYISWDAKSHDPSFPDAYVVLVSRTDDSLHHFTDTLFFTDNENYNWENRQVNLVDSIFSGEMVYLAFVNNSYDDFKLYIDNIKLDSANTLSIKEENKIIFNVYPNPFVDYVQIDVSEAYNGVNIFNLSGALIKSIPFNKEGNYSLNSINSGQYIIEIELESGLKIRKKLLK